jgi:hypothetical protein
MNRIHARIPDSRAPDLEFFGREVIPLMRAAGLRGT